MPAKYHFDSCKRGEPCTRCDIGYVLKNYVTPLMQTLTVDIRDYYMRLLTTKCLNTAVMLAIFMLGREKGIAIANYCDTVKTKYRHDNNIDDNNTILSWFKDDLFNKRPLKHRYFYYVLLTDGKFPFDNTNATNTSSNEKINQNNNNIGFFPGHVFIIEKIPNPAGGQPIYYLYQSYINQYDLKGYVEKNQNSLRISYERLSTVVEGLMYILNVEKWDDKCVEYWKKLSFVDSSYLKGSKCKGNFFLCVKRARVVDCLKHIEQYTVNKIKEVAPRVAEPAQRNDIYGDKTLFDAREKPLTVLQMYNTLKRLYRDVSNRKKSMLKNGQSGVKNL